MKIYTVTQMDKFDYDFSVTLTKHGCFQERENALSKAKEVFKQMRFNHSEDIIRYSDEDDYPEEGDGAYCQEIDTQNGYYRMSFGFEDEYEVHSVSVDEWELED